MKRFFIDESGRVFNIDHIAYVSSPNSSGNREICLPNCYINKGVFMLSKNDGDRLLDYIRERSTDRESERML